ncbi:MAG: hypothetical protein QXJ74_09710 [Nitrososphaera sp.]
MVEYYFDIETHGEGKPDPQKDRIITIQYQKLQLDGKPDGKLRILTEWDYGSEKAMLEEFRKYFLTEKLFDFVPVGLNLYGYDMICLIKRWNTLLGLNHGIELIRDKPVIDIKSLLVMMNGGRFVGHNELLGKDVSGSMVRTWYAEGKRGEILKYIENEAKNFITKYQILKREVAKIRLA